jgi:ABC-type polysaccharide/polyol phosphate transport system ATPase subunit
MYTDTVVLISQLEVTFALICNSILTVEHLTIAFYDTFKSLYLTYKSDRSRDTAKFHHGMCGLKYYHKSS